MRPITQEMVNYFNLAELKYDFMGYNIHHLDRISFHHLIVPKRLCKSKGLGDGYLFWNGAILVQETSHNYLHAIERIDRQKFLAITDLMIKENKLGKLDLDLLYEIRKILLQFEEQHYQDSTKNNKKIIKKSFITDRIQL